VLKRLILERHLDYYGVCQKRRILQRQSCPTDNELHFWINLTAEWNKSPHQRSSHAKNRHTVHEKT